MPFLVSLHQGQLERSLALQKAPEYLRVVHDQETDRWDALDLVSDTPRATEAVFVYRLRPGEPRGPIHLRFAPSNGSRWRSGYYTLVDYDRLPDEAQPPREEIATRASWDAWVARQQ